MVDTDKSSIEHIDAILTYNRRRWGGRFNPIVPCPNETIDDAGWEFLRLYDADIIKSAFQLTNDLIRRIDRELNPLTIEQPMPWENSPPYIPHLSRDNLEIFATSSLISQISQPIVGRSKFVVFDTERLQDKEVELFLKRSFGLYPVTIFSQRRFENMDLHSLLIENKSDMNGDFSKLTSTREHTYPIQLCSFPPPFPPQLPDANQDTFSVIVVNGVEDLIFSWNRVFALPKHVQTALHQIVITKELIEDSFIQTLLPGFLKSLANRHQHRSLISFLSQTLCEESLTSITANFKNNNSCNFQHERSNWILPPISEEFKSTRFNLKRYNQPKSILSQPPKGAKRFKINSPGEIVSAPPPLKAIDCQGQGHWMVDLYVESPSELISYVAGAPPWIRLPRSQIAAQALVISASRINRERIVSTQVSENQQEFVIRGIDSFSDVSGILVFPSSSAHAQFDPRSKFSTPTFKDFELSSNGKYLKGFISLFGGLPMAFEILKNRFWRNLFNDLCGHTELNQENRRSRIAHNLKKKLPEQPLDIHNDHSSLEQLVKLVQVFASQETKRVKEKTFAIFDATAKSEAEEFNKAYPEAAENYSCEIVKKHLTRLIDTGVIIPGFRLRCPQCGSAEWWALDNVKTHQICGGCRGTFPLKAEQAWAYKLNTLVANGLLHQGLLPVALVLGQLLKNSFSTFLYSPPINVKDDYESTPITDIDIVCISDGYLVLGEVKESNSLFREKDFTNMKLVADRIRPDIIIFSSLEGTPTQHLRTKISKLNDELSSIGVTAMWYELESELFEPEKLY